MKDSSNNEIYPTQLKQLGVDGVANEMNNAFNLDGSGHTSHGSNTFWSTNGSGASTGSQWVGGWAKYPEMPVKMDITLATSPTTDYPLSDSKPQGIYVGYVEPTNYAYESWDILFSESDGTFLAVSYTHLRAHETGKYRMTGYA